MDVEIYFITLYIQDSLAEPIFQFLLKTNQPGNARTKLRSSSQLSIKN